MLVSDFAFDLPEPLIAQHPRARGESRLMIVSRREGTWRESTIAGLPGVLAAGDLLVVNDTRVFPARLLGRRDPSGGAAECLLLESLGGDEWLALVHPGQKLKPGARLVFEDAARAPGLTLRAEIRERRFFGQRRIHLTLDSAAGLSMSDAIDRLGHVPLPPYIRRADSDVDRERYQTVYARSRGSIAAPTAGLHFDEPLLAAIEARGVRRVALTLHVGYGTFKPVRVDRVEDHVVEPERYDVPAATVAAIAAAQASGGRVVVVGTTSMRALESAAEATGEVRAGPGVATAFLYPGHEFRVADALLTNFHLPQSSLLMLVAAFAGRDLILEVYRDAVARGFRFYSYGDAMLIL